MKLQDCKIGTKVWYHPDQSDKNKKIPGVIYQGPDYMYGDYACMVKARNVGDYIPQWVNIHLLSKR